MKNITVLGAGMVGSAIAQDLSSEYNVTSIDLNKNALDLLPDNINKELADLADENRLKSLIKNADLVVSAVPGFMGTKTMLNVINVGKDLVDISFMPEDVLHYNQLAVDKNVTVIMDCGVAPGMANIIVGYHNKRMKIDRLDYMVGGLPKIRNYPFEYKAPFSPCDVIEEYTRPARYVENGVTVTKPAMSDVELIDFENIGTLEAFNTDGLRSLISTLPNIPNMKEKTLRYPGHVDKIKTLQVAGFFSTKPILVNGIKISPLDFSSEVLFENWKLDRNEKEFTVMRIEIIGNEEGRDKKIVYDLYDEFNSYDQTSSMARTTGYTATAAVELILENKFNEKGIFPPEMVGRYQVCYEAILKYLADRNVVYKKSEILL